MKVPSVYGFVIPAAVAGAAVLLLPAGAAAQARERYASVQPVEVGPSPSDPHWVQGQAIIDAPPGVVWERLQQVEAWPRLFSDISGMRVEQHRGDFWVIDLETKTLDHGMLRYGVTFESGRRLILQARGPGVAVETYTLVRDGPTPSQSNVVYGVYIKTSGPTHLVLSDRSLEKKQEHTVATTLADLQRAFGR